MTAIMHEWVTVPSSRSSLLVPRTQAITTPA
jgi:hypothetical protein